MKKLFKRWLAMVLAVLMVMGTLPMTAWAARIEDDVRPATPVVDGNDGVVDTLAKSGKDDDVRPVDPVDPDPVPVDPAWIDVSVDELTITDEKWTVTMTKPGITGSADGNSGSWGIAVVPDIRKTNTNSSVTLSDAWGEDDEKSEFYRGKGYAAFSTLLNALYAVTGLTAANVLTQNGSSLMFDKTAGATVEGDIASISAWRNSLNGYYLADGTEITSNTSLIPLTVLVWTNTNPNGLAFGSGWTYGGGLDDSIWVVNLVSNTVRKMAADGTMSPDSGGYENAAFSPSSSGGIITIPLEVTGANALSVPFDQMDAAEWSDGIASVTTDTDYADIEGAQGNVIGVSATQVKTFDVELKKKEPGTIVIKAPNYYATDNTYKSTATITIIVLKDNLMGSPIVFRIKEGDPTPQEAYITIVAGDYGESEDDGTPAEEYVYYDSDNGEGTTWDSALADGNEFAINCDESDDDSLYDGEYKVFYGTTSTGETGKAKIVFTPTADYINADSPYSVTMTCGDVFNEFDTCLTLIVPITIIVDPGDEEPTTYTLTYFRNGNTGGTAPGSDSQSTTESSATFTVADKGSLVKTGYTFNGWNTKANGTGTPYAVGSKYTIYNDESLYAQWAPIPYTITWNANGGTGGTTWTRDYDSLIMGSETALPTVTYSHKNFLGWFDEQTGGNEVTATSLATVKVTGDKTYWAHWDDTEYTYTFMLNGGTAEGENTSVERKSKYGDALTAPTPTRLGYNFLGWFAAATGGSALTIPATMPDTNPTVHAQWEEQGKIKFDPGDGAWATGTTAADYQKSGKVGNTTSAPAATKMEYAGHAFDHWEDSAGTTVNTFTFATGTWGSADNDWASATTYTAKWTELGAPGVVKVKLDSGAYKGLANSITLKNGGSDQAATFTESPDGTYTTTDGLGVGTYAVYIDGVDTGKTLTISAGSCTPAEVQYWTVKVSTDGNGTATMTIENDDVEAHKIVKSASTTTQVEGYVLDGKKVTWAFGDANDYFKPYNWDGNTTATNPTDNIVKTPITSYTKANNEHQAFFQEKTSKVVVNLYVDGSATPTSPGRDIVVVFNDGTPVTIASGNATTTFNGVVQQADAYSLKVEGVSYTTVSVPDAADGSTVTVSVDFATAKVATGGHGDASVKAKYGTFDKEVSTDYAAATPLMENSIVVLKGQTATWTTTGTPETNYGFSEWKDKADNTTTVLSVAMDKAEVYRKAIYGRVAYSATIKVFLNEKQLANSDMDNTKDITAAPTIAKTAGTTTETPSLTYDSGNKLWTASNLRSDNTYTVTVPTITGSYTWTITKEGENVEAKLYGVKVAAKSAMEDNQVKMAANGQSNKNRVIVKTGTEITLTPDPANGYTLAGWKVDNAKGSETVTAANKFTLTTEGVTEDVVLTPTFTFEATVETKYNNGPQDPGGTVKLVASGGTGTDVTWNAPFGTSKTATGLKTDTTYTIWVNGFDTGISFTGPGTQTVTLRKIKAEASPAAAASTGYPKVNNAAQFYVPDGAVLSASTPEVKATQGTVSSTAYRWMDKSGETLWDIKSTATGYSIADIASTGVITTKTGQTVTEDITVTVNAKPRYSITKVLGDNKVSNSTITFGTPDAAANASVSGDKATLDEGYVIAITAAPGDEREIAGWTISGGTGRKLYSSASCDTASEIATPAGYTGDTVYVKAETADATVTVNFKVRTYTITVQVNKDNGPYTGGVKVSLNDGTAVTANSTTGIATFNNMVAGEYTIYANGKNLTGNPTVTTKKVKVNKDDTPGGTGTETVNYYTVTLAVDSTGGTGYVNFGTAASGTATTVTQTYLAGSGEDINIFANPETTSEHNRFDKWEITSPATKPGGFSETTPKAKATYKLPAENILIAKTGDAFNITQTNPITLTVTFVQQYEVRVARGENAASTSPKLVGTTNEWILVDKGSSATMADPDATYGTDYYFKDWTIKSGDGTFDGTTATVGTTRVGGTFKPAEDSTIQLNLWKDAAKSGDWTYDIGRGGAQTTNPNRNVTFTINDAKDVKETFTFTKADGTSVTPVLGTDYTKTTNATTGVTEYVFAVNFLKSLALTTHTVKFDYKLDDVDGDTGSHTNKVPDLSKTVTITIVSTAYDLEKVDIKVENETGHHDFVNNPTANVNDTNRDRVVYDTHLPTDIRKDDLLTFTWYYADKAPTQGKYVEGTTSTTGWQKLSKDGTDFVNQDFQDVTDTKLKGKYVFAVVKASVTGTGAVITNSISVDYDAEITVFVDGTADTNKVSETTRAAAEARYTVWLVPEGSTVSDTNPGATTGAVQARYDTTSKTYKTLKADGTTQSALNANTRYNVYVQEVEGDTGKYIRRQVNATTPVVIDRGATTDSVVYYTVTLTPLGSKNLTASAHPYLVHATDKDGTEVGETWDTDNMPAVSAKTAVNNRTVASGKGVLSGTTVKATAAGTGWDQDYYLEWFTDETTKGTLAKKGNQQTSGTAVSNGYTTGAIADHAIEITGKLTQNTYQIRGDIKSKSTGSDKGAVDTATLTFQSGGNTYSFTGAVSSGGVPGTNQVAFTVPKSNLANGTITGNYTISATVKDGTTLEGYSVPSKTDYDQPDPIELENVTGAGDTKFAIHILKTSLKMKVADNDSDPHTTEGEGSYVQSTPTTHKEPTWTFAHYVTSPATTWTKTVTVTNTGNTPITVELGITKNSSDTIFNSTTSWDSGTTDTVTDTGNGIQFSGLVKSVTLDVDESKTFTVTVPNDLDYNDDVVYHFTFKGSDGRGGTYNEAAPTLKYDLDLSIDPVAVKSVTIQRNALGQYEENVLTIDHSVPVDDGSTPQLTRANDLEYEWRTAPAGTSSVTAANYATTTTAATGPGKNSTTYTPVTADGGKMLYLVVKGKNNAKGTVLGGPIAVQYKGVVTLWENSDKVKDDDADDYVVYLSESDTTAPTSATGIKLTYTANGEYSTADGALVPNTTYHVWTNTVKGKTDDASLQYSGKSITGAGNDGTGKADVVYHLVDTDKTGVNQSKYDDDLSVADNSKYFYNDNTIPHEYPKAAAAGVTGVDVVNKWVQQGTKVTFTYEQWEYDYDLKWSGGVSNTTHTAAAGNAGDVSPATVTYSSQLNQVKTQLVLNLYPVDANVTGTAGWVDKITMKLDDNGTTNTFTTLRTDTSNILAIDDKDLSVDTDYRIGIGKSVTFMLPKAEGYTTTAYVPSKVSSGVDSWVYKYGGVDTAGDMDNPGSVTISVTVTGVANDDTYDVDLTGEGLNLKVSEDADKLPKDKTSSKNPASGTGSIPNEGSVTYGSAKTQEIHLNYNYPTGQTMTIKVANVTEGLPIYRVRRDEDTTVNTDAITAGGFTGGTMAAGTSEEIELTIDDGLDAGTYQYGAKFYFYNQEETAGSRESYVDYLVTVIVDPLPFSKVTTKDGTVAGSYTINNYRVSTDPTTDVTPATPKDSTGLVADTDYAYQWVTTAAGVTITTDDVTWNSTTGTISLPANATACTETGHNTATYKPGTADQGRNLYLIIYAKKDTNAAKLAVSAPITQGYDGIVYVNVDDARQGKAANAPDPGYKVEFYDGTTKVADGKWKEVPGTTNQYAYVSETGLEPGKEYTVKVSRTTVETTPVMVAQSKKLTGTKIGKTIAEPGQTDTNNFTNVTQVDYYTVDVEKFSNTPYKSGTGETFASDITPKIYLDTTDVTGKTVLKGQDVTAKAQDLGGSNAGKGWTQDYTLTWQDNGDDKDTATATTAVSTGYTHENVSAATTISGRLDQNKYKVTGKIVGPDGGEVLTVTMKGGSGNKTYGLTSPTNTVAKDITDNNTWGNDGNGKLDHNDTVTFTVVKGEYDIVAYEKTGSIITKVTINADDTDLVKDRNKETLTPAVEDNDRIFTVYVEALDLSLTVADDHTDPDHTATSTSTDDKQQATHSAVYYFKGVDTNDIPLSLTNNSNSELTVTGTVTKVSSLTGVDFDAGTNLGSAPASDDKVTVSDLPDGASMAIDETIAAGKVAVAASAANTDDGIYIIKYTSTFNEQDGTANGTDKTGLTVYYVFDLTINPLPIVEVKAEKDPNETDGTLRLTDDDLDSVLVDLDGNSATSNNEGADTIGLSDATNGDIKYVWAKAAVTVTDVDKDSFTWTTGTTNSIAAKAGSGVTIITGATGRTYKPKSNEEGMNFYLIAYSAGNAKNASDFAVSAPVYAQVTISLETHRTGGSKDEIPSSKVQIKSTVGETEYTSNTATDSKAGIIVTGAGATLTFTADETADKTAPINEPANAEYYFKEWKVKGVDDSEGTTGVTTPVDGDRLTMKYAVTGQATVIGYYDKLPTLERDKGYNIVDDDVPANRAFTYTIFDGSGDVAIYIKPLNTPNGQSEFKSGTDKTSPRRLDASAFEIVGNISNGGMSDIGKDGTYRLKEDWIKDNLRPVNVRDTSEYEIIFYDISKGAHTIDEGVLVDSDGYEGYDRSVVLSIVSGEVEVNAQAENKGTQEEPEYHGTVRILNGSEEEPYPDPDVTFGPTKTSGGKVTVEAFPDPGYTFTGWDYVSTDPGTFADKSDPTTVFTPGGTNCIVQASFAAADFTATEGRAKVYYGDNKFYNENAGDLVQVGTKDPEVDTLSYSYKILTEEELTTYLAGAARPDNVYTANGKADDTNKKPDWLLFDEDHGTFAVDTNKMAKGVHVRKDDNGDDVLDELVVYVKITSNGGVSKTVPFTVDIMTTELEIENPISAADYFAAYVAGKDKEVIDHGNPVELDYFTYTSVRSVPNPADKVDEKGNAGNGTAEAPIDHGDSKWTVSPTSFDGTGPDPALTENTNKYTFTFTYKPDNEAEKWDYKSTSKMLQITVQKPPQSIQFADTITNYDKVTVGRGDEDEYSAFEKDEDPTKAPEAMAYNNNTSRKYETITYLDTEPLYQVKFRAIGKIYGATWTVDELEGFEVAEGAMPAYDGTTVIEDVTATPFTLKLAPKSEDIPTGYTGDLWVGEHRVKFIVSGFVDEAKTVAITPATYELIVVVKPKPITSLNIEIENPGDEDPKKVEGTIEVEGEETTKDLTKPDKKTVTPLKKIEIVPEIGPDETVIKRTVEVEIDPNYIYTKDNDETPGVTEPEITDTTKLNDKGKTDGNIDVERKPLPADPEKPDEPEDTDHIVFITQRIPALMFDDVKTDDGPTTNADPATTGPKKDNKRGTITITKGSTPTNRYEINLGAYGSSVYGIDVEMLANGLEGATLTPEHTDNHWDVGTLDDVTGEPAGDKYTWTLDLSGLNTEAPGTYNIKLHAKGYAYDNGDGTFSDAIEADYTITIYIPNPPSPSIPSETPCPCKVFYHIGIHGTTTDPTVEDVAEKLRPTKVPAVTPVDGYTFRGWSLTNPATLKDGEKITLVDPKTVEPKGEAMTFYAVIQQRPFHEHYVIGYPNGNFGPADDITRASVATIIARAILPEFVEGANYGNPGGYSDVSGHWAESAIAYCSKYGVFNGMPDGTFQPDRPISRQEFALVIARLDGVMEVGEMDFTDIYEAGEWALGGIYTAYANGWVNGYPDGSFKPQNNIRRDEAVKVFNAYLHRGVDADGLRDLYEYVHTGSASNNTGNGVDEYKTWADVPREHWAYYEIIEAANDHEYEAEMDGTYTVPETWNKCWIDERWRYIDSASNSGINTALVSAGFQVWLH